MLIIWHKKEVSVRRSLWLCDAVGENNFIGDDFGSKKEEGEREDSSNFDKYLWFGVTEDNSVLGAIGCKVDDEEEDIFIADNGSGIIKVAMEIAVIPIFILTFVTVVYSFFANVLEFLLM